MSINFKDSAMLDLWISGKQHTFNEVAIFGQKMAFSYTGIVQKFERDDFHNKRQFLWCIEFLKNRFLWSYPFIIQPFLKMTSQQILVISSSIYKF